MIHVATAPVAHLIGDAAAWTGGALAGWWLHRRFPAETSRLERITAPSYFVALAIGGLVGAWLFGSLNSLRWQVPTLSHSVAGALAGAILGVELWKWRHGIRGSTGAPFVLSIALGLAIGRWGCLFAGLPDGTFGTPTALPWAVDLGDGVGRHPVQIYESLTMLAFAAVWTSAALRGADWPWRRGFHLLIIVYAAQRFAWEWFKPYPALLGPFNVFHLLMLGLLLYGLLWIDRGPALARR